MNETVKTIDDYIKTFPKDTQTMMRTIRAAIRKAAPGAEETISYRIAAFRLHGRYLVYMAGFKNHVGVYPVPKGDAAFQKASAPYRSGAATMRIPLDEPVPLGLIGKLVKLRAQDNAAKAKRKKAKRKKTSRK